MKLSSTLLALSLLPMLAPLSTYAQDKDKSDKAIDKSDKSAEKAVDKVDKQDKAGNKAAVDYDVHSYRLIYTLTEIESGKKVGEQHYSMVVNPGSKQGNIRIGSKVPIKTGTYDPGNGKPDQVQFTYMDVGLNIYANLNVVPNGIQVNSSINQSTIGDSPSATSGQPVIRNTDLSSNATVPLGGRVQLGSLDIPGSTHHIDVELTLERVN